MPVLVKLSEEKPLEENYYVVREIELNSFLIYDMGIDSLENCTEEYLVKKSFFEKNYTWEQARIALDKFIKDNPEFDRGEYYSLFADDEYIEYEEYEYDEEYSYEDDSFLENSSTEVYIYDEVSENIITTNQTL